MTEPHAFQIVVIILSITLALFLVLAIIVSIYLIKLLKSANRITAKAESVAENIEHASEKFSKIAGPASAVQAMLNLLSRK
jgi:hypothetical protein